MVKREVLKDIKAYKPKFIGPFTLRQFICCFIGVLIIVPVFLFLNKIFVPEVCIIGAGLAGMFPIACGFINIYNVPLEKFFKKKIRVWLFAPKNRVYKTNNYYKQFCEKDVPYTKKQLKEIRKARKLEAKSGEETPIK